MFVSFVRSRLQRSAISVAVVNLAVAVIGLRTVIGERPMDDIGPRALLDAVFAVTLALVVVLIAIGLGQRTLRLSAMHWSLIDRTLWNAPIGLGILAYGVLALGLIGWLHPIAFAAWVALAGWWSRREWLGWLKESRAAIARAPHVWRSTGRAKRLIVLAAILIFALAVLQALTPPYDYDGLMYHLQGPRLFLQAGHIAALPDIWQANGPATLDMLFMLGLAFGSDTVAKLLHLACGLWLALGTFSCGQRYARPNGGWFAATILISIPIFSMWASWAYADMAWALFEFLGIYALILWRDRQAPAWLLLGGALMGLAMGSKYLAVGTAAFLGLWIVWQSRARGAQAIVQNSLRYGGTALLIGSPWYLKNWLLAGNPVYPLIWGGVGWDRTRLDWLIAFLYSFGNGRTPLDYVRLPWDVYLQRANFTGLVGGIEWPSPLFPLAALYVFIRRNVQLNAMGLVVLFQLIVWAFGSQQTRLLLPAFAGLSVLTGSVLVYTVQAAAVRRWKKILTIGLGGPLVGFTLVLVLLYFFTTRPWPVLLGTESKDAFLHRMDGSYAALRYIEDRLDPQARVLMMWDGRSYYCDARCLPDTAQSQWTQLYETGLSLSAMTAQLHDRGITHLLYSPNDARFVAQRDRTGRHRHAIDFFLREFQPACTRQLYGDESSMLLEVTCR